MTLDESLGQLLAGGDDRRFNPLGTPAAMTHPLFPFQERGHGWLRLLGDLGIGAILADDMGLGKTVQAIAMLASEREQYGARRIRPHARRLPDERHAPVGPRGRAFRSFASGPRPPRRRAADRHRAARVARPSDVVITSYDIATRDVDALAAVAWDRLLLDEAQDVKNPATKRARACAGSTRAARSR